MTTHRASGDAATPAIPGGEGKLAEARAAVLRRYSAPPAVFGDTVDALIAAARAEGARQERERVRENTIAIEGAGIRWDEVDAGMNYEGRCVAVKIERGKVEHAAHLAALREDIGQLVVKVHDGIKAGPIRLDVLAQSLLQLVLAPLVDIQREIRAFPIPDPTAALARVRAEAFEEAAKVAEQRGMSAEQTYGIAERAGCDMAAAAIRAKAGEARQVREADITPPAGEEAR